MRRGEIIAARELADEITDRLSQPDRLNNVDILETMALVWQTYYLLGVSVGLYPEKIDPTHALTVFDSLKHQLPNDTDPTPLVDERASTDLPPIPLTSHPTTLKRI